MCHWVSFNNDCLPSWVNMGEVFEALRNYNIFSEFLRLQEPSLINLHQVLNLSIFREKAIVTTANNFPVPYLNRLSEAK